MSLEENKTQEGQTPEQIEEQQQLEQNEAAAAFDAGFSEGRGETPAAEPAKVEAQTPADTPKNEQKQAEPAAVAVDPIDAKFAALEEKMSGRLRNIEGHIGGLKSALLTAKAVDKAGGEAPSQTQIEKAAEAPEKWKRLKADFPDWGEAVEEFMAAQIGAAKKQQQPAFDATAFRSELVKDIAPLLEEAKEAAKIEVRHTDWEDTVKTDEFKSWFKTQPEQLRQLAGSSKAKDAIQLLDAFVAHRKGQSAAPARRADQNKRLEAAIPVRGSGANSGPVIDEGDAFESGFKAVRTR